MKTGNIDATVAGTLTRKGRGAAAAAGKAQGFADLLAGAEPRHSSKDASRSPTARLHRSEPSVHATTADPTPRRAWSEAETASVPTARRSKDADTSHPPARLAAPEIRIGEIASRDATASAFAPGHAAPEPVETGRTAHRVDVGGSGEASGKSARLRPERGPDAVSLTLAKTDWPEGNPDRGPTDASLDVPAKPPVETQAAPASAQAPSSGSGPRRQEMSDTKDAVAAVTPPVSPSQARQPDQPGVTPQREAPGERAPEPADTIRSAVENLPPRDGTAAPPTAGDDRPSISRAAALFPLDDPAAARLADDRPSDRTANPVLGATPGRADFGQGVSSIASRRAEDRAYPLPNAADPVDPPRSPESSERIAARPGPDDAGKRSPEPLLADGPAEEPIAPSGDFKPASSPERVRPGISEAAAYPVPVSPEGLVPDEGDLDTSPEPKTDTNGRPAASVAATSSAMSRPDAELETVDTDVWKTVGALALRGPLYGDQPPPVTPTGQPKRAVAPEDRAQTLDASLSSPLRTAGDDPTPRSGAGEAPSHLQPSADAGARPADATMVPGEIADTSGRGRESTSTTPPPNPEVKAEPRVPPAPPTNVPAEAEAEAGDRPKHVSAVDVSVASAIAPSPSAVELQPEPAPEQPAASATAIPTPPLASAPAPTPNAEATPDRPALGMDGEDRRERVSVAAAATIAPPTVSGSGLEAAEPAMRNPIPAEPSMPRKQAPRTEAAPEKPQPEAGSPLSGDRVMAVDGAPTSAPQPGERPAASSPIPPVETQTVPGDASTRQARPSQVPPAPDRNHAPPASPVRILRPEAVSPASAATMPTTPPSTRAEPGPVTVATGADVPPAGPRQLAPSQHDLPASAEVARSEHGSPIRNQAAHDADASRSPTAQALAPTDVEPSEQGAPDPSGSIDAVAAPTTPPRDGAPSPISLETAQTVRTPIQAAPHDGSATVQPAAIPAPDDQTGRMDAASLPRQVPVTAAGSDRSTPTADRAPLATPPPAAPPAEGQPQPAAEAARRMPALATEITIAAARYRYADAGRDEERPSIHSTTRMLAGRLGLSGPSLLVAEPPRFTEPVRPSWAPAYPADMPGSQSGLEQMAGAARKNDSDDAPDRLAAPEPPAPAAPRGVEGARETLQPRPAPPPMGSPAATIASALALDSTWAPQSVAHSAHVSGNHASAAAHTLRIQLNPLHLGVVNATLRLRSSQLEIEVKVENLDAYERLKGEEHVIEKALRAQGYEAPQVTIIQPAIAAPPSAKQDGVLVAGMPQFPGSGASDQETSSGRQRQQGQQEDRNAGSSQADQTSPAHRGSGAGSGGLYI